jgi:hypothetical protein
MRRPENDPEEQRRIAAFNTRLQELGWVNGRNLRIDTRFAGDSSERVRKAAVELAARAPDVILSTTSREDLLSVDRSPHPAPEADE